MEIVRIRADLVAEQEALDGIVASLSDAQWGAQTSSAGWSVAHQIAHLTYFDRAATTAIEDPEGFAGLVSELRQATAAGGGGAVDELTLGPYLTLEPERLLAGWRTARSALAAAAAGLNDERRVDWYGPSMGSKSFLTARLMEVWAHGQDIADAVGIERKPTDRVYHIARLGFLTRNWSYVNRGLPAPDVAVKVELEAPSGEAWVFGPDEAVESLVGPALDFCLVVTQRRHVDDTALVATPSARDWMLRAQCFAGPPTDGPSPGSRP